MSGADPFPARGPLCPRCGAQTLLHITTTPDEGGEPIDVGLCRWCDAARPDGPAAAALVAWQAGGARGSAGARLLTDWIGEVHRSPDILHLGWRKFAGG